jgi:hypothetical protein
MRNEFSLQDYDIVNGVVAGTGGNDHSSSKGITFEDQQKEFQNSMNQKSSMMGRHGSGISSTALRSHAMSSKDRKSNNALQVAAQNDSILNNSTTYEQTYEINLIILKTLES